MKKCIPILILLALAIACAPAMAIVQPSVTVSLQSNPMVTNGLANFNGFDGQIQYVPNVAGVNCWSSINPATNPYMYFQVDDTWNAAGSRGDAYVNILYYDNGTTPIYLQYDSSQFGTAYDGAYAGAPVTITRMNTGGWKWFTWHVTDAYFANRQNGASDFRLYSADQYFVAYVSINIPPKVAVTYGTANIQNGIISYSGGDGVNQPATIGGLNCRQSLNSAYFYCGVDNNFAYAGNKTDLYVTIHYYDNGTSLLRLEYDSTGGGAYKSAGQFNRANTNTWKAKTWHITDAYFGNRQNFGADFRIAFVSGSNTYLSMAYVRDFQVAKRRVRIKPRQVPIVNNLFDPTPFKNLMWYPDQWATTMGHVGTMGYDDYMWTNTYFTDNEITSWLPIIHVGWNKLFGTESQVLGNAGPSGTDAFNATKPIYDHIVAMGGVIDETQMDEPYYWTVYSRKYGNITFAEQQTAIWMKLMHDNYPDIDIAGIEPYPAIGTTNLQSWLTGLNNQCAAIGTEGVFYYVMDPDWQLFPNQGSWSGVVSMINWCHTNGMPFSMIYWASPHAHSTNDADWTNDIWTEGNNLRNAGGYPDQYNIESWLNIPTYTVPETQPYTFTNSVLNFCNNFGL